MENDELISVIVPVYNAEKYIKRCAKSILNQTYRNIELVLVNDGSKDGSLEICRGIAADDSRVVVIDKENGGAASARNRGLDVATGDYIGFCDADDYLSPDMYECLLALLKKNNLETIECTSIVEDEKENVVTCDANDKNLAVISSEEAIRNILLRKGNVHLALRLTKADIIKQIRIPEGRRVEDFFFTILLLLKVKENATYSYPFYHYCLSTGSVTRNPTGSLYLDALYFLDEAKKELDKHKIDFKEEISYYKYKMYYLFSISMTDEETQKYKNLIKEFKREIRRNIFDIVRSKYLIRKEKIVLLLGSFSMKLCRKAYIIKEGA